MEAAIVVERVCLATSDKLRYNVFAPRCITQNNPFGADYYTHCIFNARCIHIAHLQLHITLFVHPSVPSDRHTLVLC